MNNNLIIRKPKQEEYYKIVKLVNIADSIFLNIYSKEKAKQMFISTENVEDLIKWEKNREYLCLYENNNLVWFSSFRVKNIQTFWLSMLYIDKKYQWRWFGNIFLNEIEKYALSKKTLVLALETDEKAIWAVKFYIKCKYKILDKSKLKKYPFDMILNKNPVKWRYIFGKIL